MFSCSSFSEQSSEQSRRSRQLAKALQAMTESAETGSLFEMKSQFTEREPNANAYLGNLLYERYCQQCHGKPSSSSLVQRSSAEDPESDYYIIRYGMKKSSGDMPGFRNRLTKFQILDVMAYIKHDPKLLAQMVKILDEYSLETFKPAKADTELQNEEAGANDNAGESVKNADE